MEPLPEAQQPHQPILPWLAAALAGVAAPCLAMMLFAGASASVSAASVAGPIMAVGLMGVGMISAAASQRLGVGIGLALLTAASLILLARVLGTMALPHPFWTGLAVTIASISFAARGALFARSAAGRGWWIAVAVVAGEAAVLATAATRPDSLPDSLLALLPAQWASTSFEAILTGSRAPFPEQIALLGTAGATLLVTRLWPRRWPYLVMFSVWLGLSALVWQSTAP
jgi:hypothetical protein